MTAWEAWGDDVEGARGALVVETFRSPNDLPLLDIYTHASGRAVVFRHDGQWSALVTDAGGGGVVFDVGWSFAAEAQAWCEATLEAAPADATPEGQGVVRALDAIGQQLRRIADAIERWTGGA